MKMILNRRFLVETGVDSGALTILGAVLHRFEPGLYVGTVLRGEDVTGQFTLQVSESSPELQADIDLAALSGQALIQFARSAAAPAAAACPPGAAQRQLFALNPRGYALFFVSQGAGGYAVVVRSTDRREAGFDSRRLGPGDVMSVTLLQPGKYLVRNAAARAELTVEVAYPDRERLRKSPDPVAIQVTERGFEPAQVQVQPSQGLVLAIQAPARIQVSMAERRTGPPGATPPGQPGEVPGGGRRPRRPPIELPGREPPRHPGRIPPVEPESRPGTPAPETPARERRATRTFKWRNPDLDKLPDE